MTNTELIQKIRAEIERLIEESDFDESANLYSLLSFLDALQEPEQTCKTCGFYENNCPFIRGKLIPYPNKVCKDYTYSVVKAEQEPEVKPDEELKNASEKYCPDDAYPFASDIINKEVRKAFIAGWKAKEESEKPIPTDLEEAAENIYKTPFGTRAEDFKAGAEWKDRSLNWIRDLVKAAIKKPEEAQGILERIDRMLNKEDEK